MHSYPLLALLLLATSCKGQDQERVAPQEPAGETAPAQETAPPGRMARTTAIPNDRFVPLFYEGQLCHWVRAIIQDENGDLWFGTNHYGVIRFNGDTVEYFTKDEGFGNSRVNGIVEDRAGHLWFAHPQGLTSYDPAATRATGRVSFTHHSTAELREAEVWTVTLARDGTFWLGTSVGVWRFDSATFSRFPLPHPDIENQTFLIAPERVSRILEDRQGDIWFGRDGYGLTRYQPSATLEPEKPAFVHFTRESGLPDNNVADLMQDAAGHLWIGTMFGGVSMYDGTSFHNFTRDGLIEGVEVYGFHQDKSGKIWFAAEHQGVYRYDPLASPTPQKASFVNFHDQAGLQSGGIQRIFEDREGRFWLGGWKGLFRYDGKAFFPVTRTGPWDP